MGGCLDLRNAIQSSAAGYRIRYLSLLTDSTCNRWTRPLCSYDALMEHASGPLCIFRPLHDPLVRLTPRRSEMPLTSKERPIETRRQEVGLGDWVVLVIRLATQA